jgi:dTMP kinase
MALFITFEGGEGSGKSVQTRALYRILSRLEIPVLLVHEPGSTSLGKKIRRWLKWDRGTDISPLSELLLFNASRAQLVADVIQPGLAKGTIIICDRFYDSTTAYQSYGRGLNLEMVNTINSTAAQGIKPDLTVLLDISVEAGLARKGAKGNDRFELEDVAFHRRVREGYLKLAAGEPERWLVIDATRPKEEIAGIIWQKVSHLLSGQGKLK